jgi:hypothetical protein
MVPNCSIHLRDSFLFCDDDYSRSVLDTLDHRDSVGAICNSGSSAQKVNGLEINYTIFNLELPGTLYLTNLTIQVYNSDPDKKLWNPIEPSSC